MSLPIRGARPEGRAGRFQRSARSGANVSLVTSPAQTRSHSASSTSRSNAPPAWAVAPWIARKNDATGALEEMTLNPTPPWNNEHRNRFRAMHLMLREILGDKAAGVVTMKAEKAQIADGTLAVSVNG